MPDIALSAKTFDLSGYIELSLAGDKQALIERRRRATVTDTLDGGVVADDGGFTRAGENWDVRVQPSRSDLEILKYLIATYGQLNCSTREGFFTVQPQALTVPSPLLIQFRLAVISQDA